MADDDRGADILTLPMINLSLPGPASDDDGVPTLPAPPNTAPPPDFTLPFHLPADEENSSEHDPDNTAGELVTQAASGTGTPTRATASMAMVTMAAVAVAALRGTWSVAAYLKARREHHAAVADKVREAADKQKVANAQKAAKSRVPSGPEFGRGAAKRGGRGGSSGSAGGGSGRGTFGQQKPSGRGGGSTRTSSGSAGADRRGTGPKKGPSSRNDSGGPGRTGAKGSGTSGSGSGKGSSGSPSKGPGTLGKMALARQKRRADDAKAQRQAAADLRKAELADRAAARRQGEKDADDRRKRKAEKRKEKLERAKAGDGDTSRKDPKLEKDDKPAKGKGDAEKVDLKKKPKTGDGTDAAPKGDKPGTGKGDAEKDGLNKGPKGNGTGDSKKSWWKPWNRGKKTSGRNTGPRAHRGRHERSQRRSTDARDVPGADGEWLKPPPGWDVAYSVTIEREPAPRPPRGAIGPGHKALPAGRGGVVTPTRTEPKVSPIVMGPAAAVGDVGDTQFVDADLTVYDLIDSDEDMGEQILQGVDHMRVVVSKCEGLKTGLENLYATCLQKKVPGVLVKWCIRLMERAGSVQDKAEALAASLPRASESILTARDVAVEADKRRADAVKDAGHVAPADRDYHDRSGV
ncbi:hypothetical protein AB0919_23140 [Streptomyces sp. NPDC046994]|uniref:hypothetical protein n=1 Tax=Streptomyces sp. NPDC046994 TaxID=3155735 RepID=UPI003454F338